MGFLPPANEVWGKLACLSVHEGWGRKGVSIMCLPAWPMFLLRWGVSVSGPMFLLGKSLSSGPMFLSGRGFLSRWPLSKGDLSVGALCPRGSLSRRFLSRRGLCQGDPLPGHRPLYGDEQVVRILLQCILVVIKVQLLNPWTCELLIIRFCLTTLKKDNDRD